MNNPRMTSAEIGGVDVRDGIRDAAVRLINTGGVAAASVPNICAAACIDEREFRRHFSTANDAFVDIVGFMLAAYGAHVGETLKRRRSLYQSIRLAQLAFLDAVRHNIDTQQALTVLRVAAISDPAFGVPADSGTTLHSQFVDNSELWLVEVGRVHDVEWELPTRLLATLTSANLTAVVLDYLAGRDAQTSRDMIDVLAFDLARRGRRKSKNQTI